MKHPNQNAIARSLVGLFLLACALSLGCHFTEYPVMFDSRGPYDNAVVTGQYAPAYMIPSATVATLWDDGSDETFTTIEQDWKGDQRLRTFNNFDPTAELIFMDQTYCDPVVGADCVNALSWNPDLPWCPDNPPATGGPLCDNIFDTEFYAAPDCRGARSLCMLIAMSSRIGECGSGVWADKQGLFGELSQLTRTTFLDRPVYALPIDDSIASFELRAADGSVTSMPIYGRFSAYLDEKWRMLLPVSANARYQLRWVKEWIETHGPTAEVAMTYGGLTAPYNVKFVNLDRALESM